MNYENWDSQRQDLLDRLYRFCEMVYSTILKKLQFSYSTKIGKNGVVTFTEEVMNPNVENPKSPHENNTYLCFFIIEFLFESYYIEKEGKNLKQQRQIKTDNYVQIKMLLKTIFVMLPTEVEYLGDSASIKTKLQNNGKFRTYNRDILDAFIKLFEEIQDEVKTNLHINKNR